jgi:hypothetical protein
MPDPNLFQSFSAIGREYLQKSYQAVVSTALIVADELK